MRGARLRQRRECGHADRPIYARRGQQRPAEETCARLGGSAHFIYAGSITQDEGSYGPGMVYDELLAGRVRDCLRRSPE